MQHLGCLAVRLGALGPIRRVVNDGAVTVLQPRPTVAAARLSAPRVRTTGHEPQFLARADAKCPETAACRGHLRLLVGLSPAEFVQSVVVDAEVVGDLVDHRDRHLVDNFFLGVAALQQRLAVDRDGVRQ